MITLEKPGGERKFPIPIRDIALWLGFSVERKSFYRNTNEFLPKLSSEVYSEEKKIVLAQSIRDLTFEQENNALARALAFKLLSKDSDFDVYDFTEFGICWNESEYLAEICAAFLLLPPVDVLDFINYLSGYVDVFSIEKVLMKLSDKAKIPYYYAILYFEHIKQLMRFSRYNNIQNEENVLSRRLKKSIPDIFFM